MPLYEYHCPLCRRKVEVIQKVGDPAPMCTECTHGHIQMVKAITHSGSYEIKGDNSASITPKKYRKENQ